MKLYGYWRSGASYRLRCALALKGVAYETVPVNLFDGEQNAPAYRAVNPLGLVPTLELDDGTRMTGSESVIEWLEETKPTPPLLPNDKTARQRVRSFCAVIGAGVQPLHNLRVLNYLKDDAGLDKDAVAKWTRTWIETGFAALEQRLADADDGSSPFAFGPNPGLAECYLMPQLYSAARFGVDMAPYPLLAAVGAACADETAFQRAHPNAQPDAPGA